MTPTSWEGLGVVADLLRAIKSESESERLKVWESSNSSVVIKDCDLFADRQADICCAIFLQLNFFPFK